MLKLAATIAFAAALMSSQALSGPYTGQDIVDGLSIVGDIARGLAGAAKAQQEMAAREANDCAARDMTDIFSGVKSREDAENLKRLIDNLSIAKRIILKCVSQNLDHGLWNAESVNGKIVVPRWNNWIASTVVFGAPTTTNDMELNCPAPVVLVGDRDPGKDPVASVHVYRYGDTGLWYVTYRFSSGATVSRGDQYDVKTVPYGRTSYWAGTLKSNPAIVDSGAIFGPSATGGYTYHETIRKDGQIIVETEARQCARVGNGAPVVTSNYPSTTDSVPIYSNGLSVIVGVTLGSAAYPMVIDTGAEMMSVTNSVARSLYERGEAETNGDYMSFRMADGSARTQQIIIVKSLTIGSHILTNVPASVVADGASMLIQFPVLNRIGKFTIDATNGTLTFQ